MTGPAERQASPHPGRTWFVEHDPVLFVLDVTSHEMGYRVDSKFVETYWLPPLGPTALVTARALVRRLSGQGPECSERIALADLAAEVGSTGATGAWSSIVRTLDRLNGFGFIVRLDDHVLVRWKAPTLRPGQVRHLPERLRDQLIVVPS